MIEVQPVTHILFPFVLGLLVLTLYRRKNILFDDIVIDEFILLGLVLGGFWPDTDSIKNFMGIEHRGIFHTWWMGAVWALAFGLVVLYWKRNKIIAFASGLAFMFGYWSHLVLDFRTYEILRYVQIVVDKILNIQLKNEAEMVLDGVLMLIIVIYVLSKALFRGGE